MWGLHPGAGNPAVTSCALCRLEAALPPPPVELRMSDEFESNGIAPLRTDPDMPGYEPPPLSAFVKIAPMVRLAREDLLGADLEPRRHGVEYDRDPDTRYEHTDHRRACVLVGGEWRIESGATGPAEGAGDRCWLDHPMIRVPIRSVPQPGDTLTVTAPPQFRHDGDWDGRVCEWWRGGGWRIIAAPVGAPATGWCALPHGDTDD